MELLLNLLKINKEWIFSGIGIFAISICLYIVKYIYKSIYKVTDRGKNIIIEGSQLKNKVVIRGSSNIIATVHGVLGDTDIKSQNKVNQNNINAGGDVVGRDKKI